jgi:hypothetical protein
MKVRRHKTAALPTLTLADFTGAQRLAFLAGWAPPSAPRGHGDRRWTTWDEYLADFEAVRAELVARHPGGQLHAPMFADRVLAYRRAHGAAALEGASRGTLRTYREKPPAPAAVIGA